MEVSPDRAADPYRAQAGWAGPGWHRAVDLGLPGRSRASLVLFRFVEVLFFVSVPGSSAVVVDCNCTTVALACGPSQRPGGPPLWLCGPPWIFGAPPRACVSLLVELWTLAVAWWTLLGALWTLPYPWRTSQSLCGLLCGFVDPSPRGFVDPPCGLVDPPGGFVDPAGDSWTLPGAWWTPGGPCRPSQWPCGPSRWPCEAPAEALWPSPSFCGPSRWF